MCVCEIGIATSVRVCVDVNVCSRRRSIDWHYIFRAAMHCVGIIISHTHTQAGVSMCSHGLSAIHLTNCVQACVCVCVIIIVITHSALFSSPSPSKSKLFLVPEVPSENLGNKCVPVVTWRDN